MLECCDSQDPTHSRKTLGDRRDRHHPPLAFIPPASKSASDRETVRPSAAARIGPPKRHEFSGPKGEDLAINLNVLTDAQLENFKKILEALGVGRSGQECYLSRRQAAEEAAKLRGYGLKQIESSRLRFGGILAQAALLAGKLPDPVCVVSAIREQHRLWRQCAKKKRTQPIIMRLTGREAEIDRDYPLTGHAAGTPKSTLMTRRDIRAAC